MESASLDVDTTTSAATPSRAALWTGRVLTGLIAAFLLFDAIGKLVPVAPVVEATQKLGFAPGTIRPIGALLAVSTVLHLVPRTQFVGAVLLTAYLGGATATHVHTGTPFWFSVAMGVLLWIAYVLRQPLVRAVL
ncbi:MAG: DoxX family protein [Myxococcales bacterium]|nr:DoxX family protein [Myxococcales bacterium]